MPFVGSNKIISNGTQNPTDSGQRLVIDGSVPSIAVNDGTYQRAQMGNLKDYTGPNGVSSPAQYGFRALDGSGNAIFDSMGLIAVMNLLSDQFTGSINQTFTGVGQGNAVDVNSSGATFTLIRQVRVFINTQIAFANNAGNTDYAYIYLDVDGAKTGMDIFSGTGFQPYTGSITTAPVLSIGSHTVKLRAYVGAGGNTGIVYKAETICFQLGA